MTRMRSSLSELNDDTAIEEDLAALYLCVSVKKLGELRANGGGPLFVKPTDPKAAGRNQPVSYVLAELRKWRASMSATSNLQVAKRQGLLGWVSAVEPFWMDLGGSSCSRKRWKDSSGSPGCRRATPSVSAGQA